MKKVLWLSRHKMTEDQLNGLHNVAGTEDLVIDHCNTTVTCAQQVAELGKDCDILAVVLPIQMISDLYGLVGKEKLICSAKTKRVFTTNKGEDPSKTKATFVFAGWDVYDYICVESHVVK